jgi:hypothetical protein
MHVCVYVCVGQGGLGMMMKARKEVGGVDRGQPRVVDESGVLILDQSIDRRCIQP